MTDGGMKTADEIEVAGASLLAWAREAESALAIAAVFSCDEESNGIALQPEALVAGSLGAFTELEVAVLLVQVEVAALTLINKMAADSDAGEESFMRTVRTARKRMLDAEGLGLCADCGG
ncbi:MAG: hypothetical protein AAFR76_05775 [Planctomycetota bacterium]